MKSKQEGVGIKAVALGHRDGNVIVVSNDINSAEDLKGKTFAIPHRQSSHNILLNDALAKANLTIDDVNITELAPTEMPSALASGQIDGYCVAEPFGAMGVSIEAGKVLYTSEQLWADSICCGLVLTDDFLQSRTDDAEKFIDSYKQAGNSLDKDSAKETAKKYLKQSDDVLDTSLQWISYNDLDITEETYNSLVEKVKKYGLSDNPPTYDEFVYQ
jgi:NitT/TauT family transport system substrate-binding protein